MLSEGLIHNFIIIYISLNVCHTRKNISTNKAMNLIKYKIKTIQN